KIYTDENKARLEAARARNEELAASGEGGFMDKVFGGSQPNVRRGKGDAAPSAAKAGGKAGGAGKPSGATSGGATRAAKPGSSGRVTPPGSRSAASRKKKRKK